MRFLAYHLFTISASCFMTLGPFFSLTMRPGLSSMSNYNNSSLMSAWESVVVPGSRWFNRSSFRSSSKAAMNLLKVQWGHIGAGFGLWQFSLVGHEFSTHLEWEGARRFDLNVWSACTQFFKCSLYTRFLTWWVVYLAWWPRIVACWAFSARLCVFTHARFGAKSRQRGRDWLSQYNR